MLTALRFSILTLILFGLLYPLAMTGLGQMLFPAQANGSLMKNNQGQVIGSSLIAQNFSRPQYFHPRPSANNYDAANSGGSNFGATNKKLIERVAASARTYQQENTIEGSIPVDAVTASGSGLDPHISLANALNQIPRIASSRHMASEVLKQLVLARAEQPIWTQSPYINVLEMNLALDKLEAKGNR